MAERGVAGNGVSYIKGWLLGVRNEGRLEAEGTGLDREQWERGYEDGQGAMDAANNEAARLDSEHRFTAKRVPIRPGVRCCAPGCGDKIKAVTDADTMIELTRDSDDAVFHLEPGCVDWFEKGHPDYGYAQGEIVWPEEEEARGG